MQATQSDKPIRLDKWLWAARFYKTRAIAQAAITGGKVHMNEQRVKPSKAVTVGAMIRLRQGFDDKEVEVLQLSDKRRSAPEAQLLYQETEASIVKREQTAEQRRILRGALPHEQRPDKRQRRQIVRFRNIHDQAADTEQ